MIRLNRTTEYGLIALRHISRKHVSDPQAVTSAREISNHYGLPFEITAKTLQRLKDTGLIASAQGARGGYTLQKSLEEVSLAAFLELMEGKQALVACADSTSEVEGACDYSGKCEIKGVMSSLNTRVMKFLEGIFLAELVESFTFTDKPYQATVQLQPLNAQARAERNG